VLEVETFHSHLFAGARGRIVAGAAADGPAVVRFSDGARANAHLRRAVLQVAPYRTATGTMIKAKAWEVGFAGDALRIMGRVGVA
jgi:hypothetical protein